MRLEARGDYKREYVDGQYQKDFSGFKGEMLDVYLQGSIGQKFSYKYRQRLNGINRDYNFFDATDWLYMAYSPSERLTLMAGKWVVLTGCWEFDPAPIDVYQLGEFCYHFPCYNWGVNAIVSTKKGNDKFVAQLTSQERCLQAYSIIFTIERFKNGSPPLMFTSLMCSSAMMSMKWQKSSKDICSV